MTKKERIYHAFNNEPVDKLPMGFWYHFSPDQDLGQQTVDDHLALYHETDMDMIKVMCDGFFGYPNPFIETVTNANDWFSMTPLGKDHPFLQDQVARAKGIVKGVNGECCVFYNVFCPMSLMRFGTSEELLMKHMKENPEAVCHAFDVIAEDIKTLIYLLLKEAGCDGIYYCVQNAEEFRFTEEEYKKYVRPAELDVLNFANSLSENNILHCCGWAGDKNRVSVWKDYPVKAVNWAIYVEDLSLKEGKNFFGDCCVLGGFDNRKEGLLYSGSKEEVENEVEKIVREAGTRGIILGADCTLPSDISKERILWVRRKLDEMASHE